MTRIFSGDLSVFEVDLDMSCFEIYFLVIIDNNLVIFVGVHTSNDNALIIILVVRDLIIEFNVSGITSLLLHNRSWNPCDSNIDFSENLQLVPVPEDQLPVGLTSKGDNELVFIFPTESSA
jgi:hypothetical protein